MNQVVPLKELNISAFDYFLIVDIESTCCDKDSIPKGEHEIIEIGAVMVEAESLKQIDAFNTFIQPIRHSQLTKFCSDLTSITQQNVQAAPTFSDSASLFSKWLDNYRNYLFCSWGNYDRNHMASDSAFHGVSNPIEVPHLNIKKGFAKKQKTRAMGMQFALELIGEPLTGRHHRGIDDATNMVKLLPYALGQKSL